MSTFRAGWYTDPADPALVRWWDGNGWTSNVLDHPEPPPPTPPAPPPVAPEPAPEPPATIERPAPAPLTTGMMHEEQSIGAALLPPLPKPAFEPPTSVMDERTMWQTSGTGRGPLYAVMAVLVVIALGGGAYFSGMLGSSGEQHASRVASSDAVQVFDGKGYSLEVPKDWKQAPDVTIGIGSATTTIANFVAPDGVDLGVIQSPANDKFPDDVQDPAVRQQIVGLVATGITTTNPGMKVVSTAPIGINGVEAVRVTLEGIVQGKPTRTILDGFVLHHRIWALSISGPPEAVDAETNTYMAIAVTLQFD